MIERASYVQYSFTNWRSLDSVYDLVGADHELDHHHLSLREQ
jgi:hypothetical protein